MCNPSCFALVDCFRNILYDWFISLIPLYMLSDHHKHGFHACVYSVHGVYGVWYIYIYLVCIVCTACPAVYTHNNDTFLFLTLWLYGWYEIVYHWRAYRWRGPFQVPHTNHFGLLFTLFIPYTLYTLYLLRQKGSQLNEIITSLLLNYKQTYRLLILRFAWIIPRHIWQSRAIWTIWASILQTIDYIGTIKGLYRSI